jgi:hypothetical protein
MGTETSHAHILTSSGHSDREPPKSATMAWSFRGSRATTRKISRDASDNNQSTKVVAVAE